MLIFKFHIAISGIDLISILLQEHIPFKVQGTKVSHNIDISEQWQSSPLTCSSTPPPHLSILSSPPHQLVPVSSSSPPGFFSSFLHNVSIVFFLSPFPISFNCFLLACLSLLLFHIIFALKVLEKGKVFQMKTNT